MFVGKVSVKLLVTIKWEDRTIEAIELDFSKMSGELINKCHRETFNNEGNISVALLPAQTPEYCARMAAEISGVPYRAIVKMNAFDYETVCHVVGAFINKRNPQKFYDEYVKLRDNADNDDDESEEKSDSLDFTTPAEKPDEK